MDEIQTVNDSQSRTPGRGNAFCKLLGMYVLLSNSFLLLFNYRIYDSDFIQRVKMNYFPYVCVSEYFWIKVIETYLTIRLYKFRSSENVMMNFPDLIQTGNVYHPSASHEGLS